MLKRMTLVLGLVAAGLAADPAWAGETSLIQLAQADCSFLPMSSPPNWITKRPDIPGHYVGVGQASRQGNPPISPEDQIKASEVSAREKIASAIETKISSDLEQILTEVNGKSDDSLKAMVRSQAHATLQNSKIREQWLDRHSCLVHTLATISEEDVQKYRDLQLKLKRVMLFDLSPAKTDMADALRGQLEDVFRKSGNFVAHQDARLARCPFENQPICQEAGNAILVGYMVTLDKEGLSADGQFRYRMYKAKGKAQFKDRTVSSFDELCRAVGKASMELQALDRMGADECMKKARPKLEEVFPTSSKD